MAQDRVQYDDSRMYDTLKKKTKKNGERSLIRSLVDTTNNNIMVISVHNEFITRHKNAVGLYYKRYISCLALIFISSPNNSKSRAGIEG